MEALELVAAATTSNIPVTDVSGQLTITLPPTTQDWQSAQIQINRSGVGGSHPWLNSLTPTDTLGVNFQWSGDNGATWNDLGTDRETGGTVTTVKNGQTFVVQNNVIGVGIGRVFPTGTLFRVILTASTPLTFNGQATYQ